jgi:hypothetical protein
MQNLDYLPQQSEERMSLLNMGKHNSLQGKGRVHSTGHPGGGNLVRSSRNSAPFMIPSLKLNDIGSKRLRHLSGGAQLEIGDGEPQSICL